MAKFNFLKSRAVPTEIPTNAAPPARIRATAIDRFEGLRGHDYIAARGLNHPAQRVHTSAQTGEPHA